MRLQLYYNNIYKFEYISKFNIIIYNKNLNLVISKLHLITFYDEYLLFEFIFNQFFNIKNHYNILRKKKFWIFVENYISSIFFQKNPQKAIIAFFFNISLLKKLKIKYEVFDYKKYKTKYYY